LVRGLAQPIERAGLVLFPATRVYAENACGGLPRIVLQSSSARSRGNKRTPSGVSPIAGVRPAGGGKEMDNNQNGGVDRLMWPFRPIAQLIALDDNSEPG